MESDYPGDYTSPHEFSLDWLQNCPSDQIDRRIHEHLTDNRVRTSFARYVGSHPELINSEGIFKRIHLIKCEIEQNKTNGWTSYVIPKFVVNFFFGKNQAYQTKESNAINHRIESLAINHPEQLCSFISTNLDEIKKNPGISAFLKSAAETHLISSEEWFKIEVLLFDSSSGSEQSRDPRISAIIKRIGPNPTIDSRFIDRELPHLELLAIHDPKAFLEIFTNFLKRDPDHNHSFCVPPIFSRIFDMLLKLKPANENLIMDFLNISWGIKNDFNLLSFAIDELLRFSKEIQLLSPDLFISIFCDPHTYSEVKEFNLMANFLLEKPNLNPSSKEKILDWLALDLASIKTSKRKRFFDEIQFMIYEPPLAAKVIKKIEQTGLTESFIKNLSKSSIDKMKIPGCSDKELEDLAAAVLNQIFYNDNKNAFRCFVSHFQLDTKVVIQKCLEMGALRCLNSTVSSDDVKKFRDPNGNTALQVVVKSTDATWKMLDYLLHECGFTHRINDVNQDEDTALDLSLRAGQYAFARVLKAYGGKGKVNENSTELARPENASRHYLGLVKGRSQDQKLPNSNNFWIVLQAILQEMSVLPSVDAELKNKLGMLILLGFSKAGPPRPIQFKEQTLNEGSLSPFFQKKYYRLSEWASLKALHDALAHELDLKEATLVNSPLAMEELKRLKISGGDRWVEISSVDDFKQIFRKHIETVNSSNGALPYETYFDFTSYLLNKGINCDFDLSDFDLVAQEILEEYKSTNPMLRYKSLRITPCGIGKSRDTFVLTFDFKTKEDTIFKRLKYASNRLNLSKCENEINFAGFCLNLDARREALFKWIGIDQLFANLDIPEAALATQGVEFPYIAESFEGIFDTNAYQTFKALGSDDSAPPYARIMSEVTCRLLEGMAGRNIEDLFQKKGVPQLLQICFFQISNSLKEAYFRRSSSEAFMNQIEVIHQQIQIIHAIVTLDPEMAYASDELSNIWNRRLTDGETPVIPNELTEVIGDPKVYAKNSGMRCFSSLLAAVERQKNSNLLNVCVLKNSYFEEIDALQMNQAYRCSVLDSSVLDDEKPVEMALEHSKDSKEIEETLPRKFDLYVCDFHHNIQTSKTIYKPENVLYQIKKMYEAGLFQDQFTVAVDFTMCKDQERQLHEVTADPFIQDLIAKGKLNLMFFKSAQKFDMFGIDNYNGGLAITLNNEKAFGSFNRRMEHPQDQLSGLSYQGLTHNYKYGADCLHKYRREMWNNLSRLYERLPPSLISQDGVDKDFAISAIQEESTMFLHLSANQAFDKNFLADLSRLMRKFMHDQGKLLTKRPSFGFVNSNLGSIDDHNFRLVIGLESKETVDLYAEGFSILDRVIKEVDEELSSEISVAPLNQDRQAVMQTRGKRILSKLESKMAA